MSLLRRFVLVLVRINDVVEQVANQAAACVLDGQLLDLAYPGVQVPAARFDETGKLRTFYHSEYFRSVSRLPEIGPLAPERERLLDRYDFLGASPDFHLDMDLAPGDMQFLHNHVILHSRNDFENWPQAERHRHLLRLWLAPAQGRPLPEVFAPRYGSVTPGARGGIVVRGTRPTVPLEAA